MLLLVISDSVHVKRVSEHTSLIIEVLVMFAWRSLPGGRSVRRNPVGGASGAGWRGEGNRVFARDFVEAMASSIFPIYVPEPSFFVTDQVSLFPSSFWIYCMYIFYSFLTPNVAGILLTRPFRIFR